MRRFQIYLSVLLVAIVGLALAVDWLNVALIRSAPGNSIAKMERLYSNPEPYEIAILGSSRALANFVPSEISPRCFNYGINAMRMQEVMELLKVVKSRPTDAPVIVNIDPWGGFTGTTFQGDYRLAPQSGRLSLGDRLPGLRFFGSLRNNLVSAIEERRTVTKRIDRGARLMLTSRTPEEWKVINAKGGVMQFVSNPEKEDEFVSLLASFSPRRIILVVGPCAALWTSRFSTHAQLNSFLFRCSNLANVSVVNYFGSRDFTDADFTDPTHLNIQGARKLSKLLKSQFGRNGMKTLCNAVDGEDVWRGGLGRMVE